MNERKEIELREIFSEKNGTDGGNRGFFERHPFLARIRGAAADYFSVYVDKSGEAESGGKVYGAERLMRGFGMAALGFLFGRGRFIFATYPLGIGLIAGSGADAPYVYAGLILSVLLAKEQAFPLFLVYTLAVTLRFICSKYFLVEKPASAKAKRRKKRLTKAEAELSALKSIFTDGDYFAEPAGYRVGAALVSAFVYGMYRCVAGGFLYYDFFAAVSVMISAPLSAYMYYCAREPSKRFTTSGDAGRLALAASAVFSLSGMTVFGFSLSAIAAFVITLYTSKESGTLRGGVVGLCCGVAYNFLYCPVFAFAGLLSGLFWGVGAWAATLAGAVIAAACGVYLGGFDSLRLFAPDILAASIVFCPLAEMGLLPSRRLWSGAEAMPQKTASEAAMAKIKADDASEKINEYSEAFASLSELFYSLSEKMRCPDGRSIRASLESVLEVRCGDCPKKDSCWDADFSRTSKAMNALAQKLRDGGRLRTADAPMFLKNVCGRLDDIVSDLNSEYAGILRRSINEDRTEVFAMDYEMMAKLLRSAAEDSMDEYKVNEDMTRRLKSVARYLNFNLNNIVAYGRRKISVIAGGVDLSRVRLSGEEIRRSFERACGVRMDTPSFSMESDYITMSLSQARIFTVSRAIASKTKQTERINGDTSSVFENKNDYFYSMISDGMGSGRDAALCSKLCCVFLEKMLRCGNSKPVSVGMLNNFLRNNNTDAEAFATVDLFEADLLSGKASFIKAGAPASFVVREGSLFKIESNTLPVGVTTEISAQEIRLGLRPGDIVVMISDGVAQSFEDGIWLADILTGEKYADMPLAELADTILEKAAEHSSKPDDMTAVVMRMEKI